MTNIEFAFRACFILVPCLSCVLPSTPGADAAEVARDDKDMIGGTGLFDLDTCPELVVGSTYRLHINAPGDLSRPGSERSERKKSEPAITWVLEGPGALEVLGRMAEDLVVTVIAPSETTGDLRLTATWNDGKASPQHVTCVTTAVAARIARVDFAGDGRVDVAEDCSAPPCPLVEGPAWVASTAESTSDTDTLHAPVAYLAGTTIVLEDVSFSVWPEDWVSSAWVEAAGPDALAFAAPARIEAGVGRLVHGKVGATAPLPMAVRAIEPLVIQWTLELPSGARIDAGQSQNPVYVTLDRPLGDRLESYFAIGCRAASGVGTTREVIDAIWASFASLHVSNARGDVMGYYRGTTCAADLDVFDAPGLVTALNGQCGAWQDLFIQVLRTQGIAGALPVTVEPEDDEGFLVQRYRFDDPTTAPGCTSYPWLFDNPCDESTERTDIVDEDGFPGQDEPDPASVFSRHFIVKLDGRYYDPSYGVGPLDGTRHEASAAWEAMSIAGYLGYCGTTLAAREDNLAAREVTFDR